MLTRYNKWIFNDLMKGLATTVTLVTIAIQAANASDEPPAATQSAKGAETGGMEARHSAEIGILVGATPGSGVLVIDVVPHSPAATSGLEPGDFLLAIDGKAISSPQELRELVLAKKPGTQAKLSIWRQGTTIEREVTLAARSAEQSSAQEKPWLGVVLEASDQPGAQIELVHPLSPAKQAGLRRGDLIVQIDGGKVQSVEDAVTQLERLKPQTTISIVVVRDGKEDTVKATLGGTSEALGGFAHGAMRPLGPSDGLRNFPFDEHDSLQEQRVMIEQLRDELTSLRKEMRRLQGKSKRKNSKQPQDSNESGKSKTTESGVKRSEDRDGDTASTRALPATLTLPSSTYLAQYGQYAPYNRYPAPTYRYYRYPALPPPYPYSYYYYRGVPYYYSPGLPYYYSYVPPYATPYVAPYYGGPGVAVGVGPGVAVRVGPNVYYRRWR
jgi:hypothetical protein